MICPKCKTENASNAKFCAECGTRIDSICPSCGADNPPNAKFCTQCGTPRTTAAKFPSPAPEHGEAANRQRPRGDAHLAEPVRMAHSTDAPLDGERKTVTALFADIKGSMDLIEDLDPEQARAMVDPALTIMIDAVHRYDGYIVQSTGDGVFALFGAPVAHEDHPHRALLAALRMQDEMRRYCARLRAAGNSPIEVRIGVNTGEAVVRTIKTDELHAEYTPIGHSTSLAARMQALAPTGSIAITEHLRRLVEGYFDLKPMGPTRVKGLSDPIEVFEVVGLGPLRTRLQASARRGLSKFVGRENDMAQIRRALELARSGHGQIVAAVGEAGVGKSRLFHEFKIVSHAGCMILEAFSVSHGKASSYLPLIDLLRSYFEITPDDDERKRREKIGGKVLMLDRALEDTLPYLFSLLGVSEDDPRLAEMDPDIRRRRTLDAVKRLILRESLNQPIILIFEDLHWIDAETQVFLTMFADSIGTARILMLVNYRPEYRHEWGGKSYYIQLRLDPLGQETAEEMLNALLGADRELAPIRRLVIERTQGNPFFIEETVQAMFEQGILARNGKVRLNRPLDSIRIPPTVKGILAARIDRLSPPLKELLQALSIVGKEFSLGLVKRVIGSGEEQLAPMLSELQLGEFIYEQPAFPDTEYVFKHALTQEVAYDSVLIERRKLVHERTAQALEEIYAAQIEDHLPDLAHHFGRSGNAEKAVAYLERAAEQAREQSAYSEAIERYTIALEMLERTPPGPQRDAREVRMRASFGQIIAAAKGFQSPAVQDQITRIKELSERLTDPASRYVSLFSLWNIDYIRGDLGSAQGSAERALAALPTGSDPARIGSAESALGVTLLWTGNVLEAREHLERGAAIFDRDLDRLLPSMFIPVIPNRSQLSWALWMQGYPEQAFRRSEEAVSMAMRLGRPFSIAFALQYAISLDSFTHNWASMKPRAETLLAIASENGMPQWTAAGKVGLGSVRAIAGDEDRGFATIREGLEEMQGCGAELIYRFLLVVLAQVCRIVRRPKQGLAALDLASEHVESKNQRMMESEIGRLRGELLLLGGGEEADAERHFRHAIGIAAARGTRSWELRAAVSLGRLLLSQGRHEEARAIIRPVYDFFTEGFETGDLREARAILEQVAAQAR